MKKTAGFTLMELMLVIAIIILLSAAVTATVSVSIEKAKKGKAIAEMAEIATACKLFYKDTGAWPYHTVRLYKSIYVGYDEYGETWQYFDESKWNGPYLKTFDDYTSCKDPWGERIYEIYLDTSENPYKLYVRAPGSNIDEPDERLKVLVHSFKKK